MTSEKNAIPPQPTEYTQKTASTTGKLIDEIDKLNRNLIEDLKAMDTQDHTLRLKCTTLQASLGAISLILKQHIKALNQLFR